MNIFLQIVLGVLYSNLIEWVSHKYFLHFLGKKKNSLFSFHWYEHHKICRKSNFRDLNYDKVWWEKKERWPEVLSLFIMTISQIWLFWVFPFFYLTCVFWAFLYYFLHKKCHKDIIWGRKWMPWHYDHHMGENQDLNWCVTFPWWDVVFGTRKSYKYDKNGKRI